MIANWKKLGVLLVPAVALALPLLARQAAQEKPEGQEEQESPEQLEGAENGSTPIPGARPMIPLGEAASYTFTVQPRQTPFLVARPDGRIELGSLMSKLDRGDFVELRDTSTIRDVDVSAVARHVNTVPVEVIRPTGVVDAQGRIVCVWTQPVEGRPQLFVTREMSTGFTPPIALTKGPAPNLNSELALHSDGRLWVTWESDVAVPGRERPTRDVLAAPIDDELALGAPIRVGDGPGSDLDANVVSAGGKLWFSWTTYLGRDYDVMVRSLDPKSGELSAPLDVSAEGASDDVHSAIAAAPDGALWVAWDHVVLPLRGCSLPGDFRPNSPAIEISLRCACVRDGKVLLPKSTVEGVADGMVAGAPCLSAGGGQPRLAFDHQGRLWIAYRYLQRLQKTKSRYGFTVVLQHLEASGWSDPLQVTGSCGMLEAPALIAEQDGVMAAYQSDLRLDLRRRDRLDIPENLVEPLIARGLLFSRWNGASSLGFARAAVEGSEPPVLPPMVDRIERREPAHYHPVADVLADPFVNGDRHFEIARGDEHYQVFWGDLHVHSSVSRCSIGFEPTPEDRWAWGRDIHLCDFMALTDHTGAIDPLAWWRLDKLGWLYASSSFCTMMGWEWSTNDWGHHNVILRDRMSSLVSDRSTLDDLYRALKPGDCVTIPHHSAHKKFPNDFPACDDRFTRLIEVYQACRGNFEFDGCYRQGMDAVTTGCFVQDALQQGHHFGIIASSDHRFGNSYACVLAPRLDRASIFDALYSRRTYGATTKGMLVDFRMSDGRGEALMGEEFTASGPVKARLVAHGFHELADVALFKDGRLFRSTPRGRSIANEFAPLRLLVRLSPPPAGDVAPFTISVRAPDAKFELLLERAGDHHSSFGWYLGKGEAAFTLPEGFAAQAPSVDFPIHLYARPAEPLAIVAPGGETKVTVQELLEKPLTGKAGASSWSLQIDAGDTLLDLSKGLGTRDFTGEWEDREDPGAPTGTSGASWYYARIVQVDGEMAWSSPVFVKHP